MPPTSAHQPSHPIGAIDRTSSFDDIDDAFRRHGGAELAVEQDGGSWVATVTLMQHETLTATAGSRDEAARTAWTEYISRNEGIGAS